MINKKTKQEIIQFGKTLVNEDELSYELVDDDAIISEEGEVSLPVGGELVATHIFLAFKRTPFHECCHRECVGMPAMNWWVDNQYFTSASGEDYYLLAGVVRD